MSQTTNLPICYHSLKALQPTHSDYTCPDRIVAASDDDLGSV